MRPKGLRMPRRGGHEQAWQKAGGSWGNTYENGNSKLPAFFQQPSSLGEPPEKREFHLEEKMRETFIQEKKQQSLPRSQISVDVLKHASCLST
eukprot:767680-Hanusia_phi.AAC.1